MVTLIGNEVFLPFATSLQPHLLGPVTLDEHMGDAFIFTAQGTLGC